MQNLEFTYLLKNIGIADNIGFAPKKSLPNPRSHCSKFKKKIKMGQL